MSLGSTEAPSQPPPMFVVRTLLALTGFLSKLRRKLMPPFLTMLELSFDSYFLSNAVFLAGRLGLADALLDGPRDGEELAARVGADPAALRRLLRVLVSAGVFKERADRRFELTSLSRLLLKEHPAGLHHAISSTGGGWHHQLWGELEHIIRTGQSADRRVLGMPLFQFFKENPDVGETFNRWMVALSHQMIEAFLGTYRMDGARKLVDVGGGFGQLAVAALARYPQMSAILFDLPHVVARAKEWLAPSGLGPRLELLGGDFLKEIPTGGDVYVLLNILHDWGDEQAIQILKNCRRAMSAGQKVLSIGIVLPERYLPHPGNLLDLEMMVLFEGGRERTEQQHRALYQAAGFRLTRVVALPSSVSVIEGIPV